MSDLIYMRKGAGFVAGRIADAGSLRHALGGLDEPFENLRERFISAIHSLRDPDPDLLLAAYGLTPETTTLPTLRQRREHYGQLIGRGNDTIAAREDAALEHLRAQLLTGWYPASPLSVRIPELHNGIVQESVEVITVVRDRRWYQSRHHYRFLAVFDEADYLNVSSSYPGRPITTGDFTATTKRIGDSYSHYFWRKPPMRRGHVYDLQFMLVPDPDLGTPPILREESMAFHERTLTATFRTVFQGRKPEHIWSFERLTFFERPGDPVYGTPLELTGKSEVSARFHDLYGGLFNGIAWDWGTSQTQT